VSDAAEASNGSGVVAGAIERDGGLSRAGRK
jgi:hypothetical protein